MKTLRANEAGKTLANLIETAAMLHEPILITGKSTNAVLLSEDDWRAVQETLFLLSIPGLSESVREGPATTLEECATELQW
jgi:antitoxin YefM